MHRILMHMDADGYCAGAIVAHSLADSEQVCYHPLNYGMHLPEIDYDNDFVYLVDFTLQPDGALVELAARLGDRLVWIDHHRTAVQTEKDNNLGHVRGVRLEHFPTAGDEDKVPVSGCELTWNYFYPDKAINPVVALIGDWDTWRHVEKGNSDKAKSFQLFLKTFDCNPMHSQAWWSGVFSLKNTSIKGKFLHDCLAMGKNIAFYQKNQDENLMKSKGFTALFGGHRAVMVNQAGNSTMFDSVFDPEKHDIMVTFQWGDLEYLSISMYTTKTNVINCGELARELGHKGDKPSGGGHPGAAGFQCGWEYFKSLIENPQKI
jgi:oligoribonuclease NrnB/cAMP/cGMP phosphodiesterase (DHH superfamily)